MKRVVLCRPQGPRNVGSALRAVENLGPADLFLVRPERPALLEHPEFEQMAHGVEDFENKVHVVDSLEEALAECTDSVGFTARARHHRIVEPLRAVQSEVAALCAEPERRVALVFGSEVSGLDETETDLCQRLVHIELTGGHASLNLATAVALVLFAVQSPPAALAKTSSGVPLAGKDREFLVHNVAETLAGKAWTESAARDIRASVTRVLRGARLETRDARAWHMAMRALGSERTPKDLGKEPSGGGATPSDSL